MGYDAFISYSRAADDDLAPHVQRALERLQRPWYRRKPFLRIIRDTTSFGASADLTGTINQALDECGHLVLLVSPGSAASPWTNLEVEHWLATKGASSITTVITEWAADVGRPVDQLTSLNEFDWRGPDVPTALRELEHEPLAVDLRWANDDAARRDQPERWNDAIAQIAAGVKGVTKDELIGELVTLRTRARIITTSIAIATVILLAGMVLGLVSWYLADQRRDLAEDAQRAAETEADYQEELAGVRRSANVASSLLESNLVGALDAAVDSLDRARQLAAAYPDRDEPTGDLQALGVILAGLTERTNPASLVAGNYVDVAVAGDRHVVVSGALDNAATWLVPDDPAAPLRMLSNEPGTVGASPDGEFAALGYHELVEVFDLRTGDATTFVQDPPTDETVRAAAVGGGVVVGGGDRGTVWIGVLDGASAGSMRASPSVALEYVTDVAVDPSGRLVAWAGVAQPGMASAGLIVLDDLGIAIEVIPLPLIDVGDGSAQVSFDPSCTAGCSLAVTSRAYAPQIWWVDADGSIPTGAPSVRCETCGPQVEAVAWSADGSRIAFGDIDGGISIWAHHDGVLEQLPETLLIERGAVRRLAFAGDDVLATSVEPGNLTRWRPSRPSPIVRGGRVVVPDEAHPRSLDAVAGAPTGGMVATGGADGSVRLWVGRPDQLAEVSAWAPWCDSECVGVSPPPTAFDCQTASADRVRSLDWVQASSTTLLAAGSGHDADCGAGHVRVWSLASSSEQLGTPVELELPSGVEIAAVAFDEASCDAGARCILLAGGHPAPGESEYLWAWEWEQGDGSFRRLASFDRDVTNSAGINAIDIADRDGEVVVVIGDEDGRIITGGLDDVLAAAPRLPEASASASGQVLAAAIDPIDRGLLVVGGDGGRVELRRLDALDDEPPRFGAFADQVTGLAWSADGRVVTVTSNDGSVGVYDVTDAAAPVAIVGPRRLHEAAVRAVDVLASGALVTVSEVARPEFAGIGTVLEWEIGATAVRDIACSFARLGPTIRPDDAADADGAVGLC